MIYLKKFENHTVYESNKNNLILPNISLCVQEDAVYYNPTRNYVNLGLPSGLLWAKGNLVKDSQGNYSIGNETDQGIYCSWGNIVGYNEGEGYDFSYANYQTTPGYSVSAGIPSTDAQHDIALATLGTPWHLPTKNDFQELYDNTDCEWVADYNGTGVAGRKFMKKTEHLVYVFFPASGYYRSLTLYDFCVDGNWWSSSIYSNNNDKAYNISFNPNKVSPQFNANRHTGFNVRPVQ